MIKDNSREAGSVCNICPRGCNVDRDIKTGYCGMTNTLKVARASLHMWEEPCISGETGSGTVFFSGCNLRCIYCQNVNIAAGAAGRYISIDRLAEIFLELQAKGANNINLVTPSHYVYQIKEAVILARNRGLSLPIVYNTSSYELPETLKLLEGIVDIYLCDFKYMDDTLALRYSKAPDYSTVAKAALKEMHRQVKGAIIEDGLMKRGIIARHLILPGSTKDSKAVIEYLYETYGDDIYISIMNQYTPLEAVKDIVPLNRRVTKREYDSVIDYAIELGITNAYVQDGTAAMASFIPEFDCEGV